jgi:hypothetical protein
MRKQKMLSPSQYAEKIGKPYQTVMTWLRQGRIAGAVKQEIGKMAIYQIPENAVASAPPMGRPKKAAKKGAGK